jgi:5-methylcytosine-specific restriction endonuclease McrA
MKEQPTEDELLSLYIDQKISPDQIGSLFGVSGRTVRNLMDKYGIPRLGPAHLRKGKSAVWNQGRKRSDEAKEKNRAAHAGKSPANKGKGSVKFNCTVCGIEVFDKPYRRKHTCSSECRDRLLESLTGKKSWNYKGDQAAFRQRERNWSEYRKWRKSVFERDGFACLKCKAKGGRLTAHHLNSFASNPSERFDLDNGATLCWKCHWQFHRIYGHKDCAASQFQEWITKC